MWARSRTYQTQRTANNLNREWNKLVINAIGRDLRRGYRKRFTAMETTKTKPSRRWYRETIDGKQSEKELADALYEEYQELHDTTHEYYSDLKKLPMGKEDYTKFLNGVKLPYNEQDKLVKVYYNNKYRGLGQIKDGILKRYLIENE